MALPEKGGGPHFRKKSRDSGGGSPLAAAGPVGESPLATANVRLGVGPIKAVQRTSVLQHFKEGVALAWCRCGPFVFALATMGLMSGRPTRFEHNRYLGDKRSQVVYDLDDPTTPAVLIDELVESEQGATFGPDTLPEARNRNYRLYRPRR
jgi:hypothetical protein